MFEMGCLCNLSSTCHSSYIFQQEGSEINLSCSGFVMYVSSLQGQHISQVHDFRNVNPERKNKGATMKTGQFCGETVVMRIPNKAHDLFYLFIYLFILCCHTLSVFKIDDRPSAPAHLICCYLLVMLVR